jgi:DNA invertase Pin-like site-specific DNA recombinase
MTKPMRAALYLRVSTGEQTVENQRRDLEAAAAQRGWEVVATFTDAGISGAKARDKRPGLDALLKGATRGQFDVAVVWAVDRMGRSLPDLLSTLQELHSARVDLFLHQQAIDTTTPAGRALFGMLGVFAEFERSMIQSRVKAGLTRAQAEQAAGVVRRRADGTRKRAIGRPRLPQAKVAAILARLADGSGDGMGKIARELGVGTGSVFRLSAASRTAPAPS